MQPHGAPTGATGASSGEMLVGLHPVQVGVGGPTVLVNLLVILAVVRRVALFRGWWNNITFTAGK